MSNPFLARDTGFLRICGHRGHNVSAPENTFAAFRAAKDLGASSLEIDTVLTADNEIVVIHDLLVDRTSNGTGAVKDMSLADIQGLDAGAWYDPKFAGARIPTLAETIALAHELDMVLEVEIKEKVHLDRYLTALKAAVADPDDLARVMMISFDHANLKVVKAAIPGIRTGGIVHEKFPDPLAVARISDLDELCIDLDVFDPVGAEQLHAAGIAIRCHAYSPRTWDRARKSGLNWDETLPQYLRAGLIDTLSGDDVGWLKDFVSASGCER
ncbi:glycerophosphoryl diester phosphodiesterase [Devosia sp. UYZn731]|uniref:glycerophosphodiester phosphodiesterase n=1 Tax=Devosia sp. UYZn731 TaxID=3156345 RepID=UPI003394D819